MKNANGSVIPRLLSYTKPFLPMLLLALVLSSVQIAATLFVPVFIGNAVDYIIGEGSVDFAVVTQCIIQIAIAVFIAVVCQYLSSLLTGAVSYKTIKRLRIEAFNKLSDVPLKFIDSNSHGDIISRLVNDIDQISDGLIQGFTQLFSGIVAIIGTLVFMLRINVMLALAVVIITPISLFVAYFIAKGTHKTFSQQSAKQGELLGHSNEMLSAFTTVRLFRYEKKAEERFDKINGELKTVGQNAAFYAALINPATRFVNNLVYIAVCVLGVLLVISQGGITIVGISAGLLTVGELYTFLSYATQYSKPFNEITGVVAELQTAISGARRVFAILDAENLSPDGENELVNIAGNVDITDLEFHYSPDKPLIDGFSLSVKSGRRIAIVGPTGCGKTTLINLLMRFYDPVSGKIEIDGQDITTVTRQSLRANIGMVLQDTWLKTATIRENIAYGRPDASENEIIEAAKSAHIHNFITGLPEGYDTLLDDNGARISQGQKQLLCIARVILERPPLLILDEATSNIDTRTERRIQAAFDTLMKNKTSFIVAHRLSTIKSADTILVMRDGNIIEKGTHEGLLQLNGFYSELYNSQFEN